LARRGVTDTATAGVAGTLASVPLDEVENVAPSVPYGTANLNKFTALAAGALALNRPLGAAAYPRVLSLHEQIVEVVHVVHRHVRDALWAPSDGTMR
jgi:hypothetical protein